MLLVCGRYKYFNSFSAGIVFIILSLICGLWYNIYETFGERLVFAQN